MRAGCRRVGLIASLLALGGVTAPDASCVAASGGDDAATLRALGQLDAAQRALEARFAASAPDDLAREELLPRLAELAIAQDDLSAARRWLDDWRAHQAARGGVPDPALARELEGRLLRKAGRYDEAAARFEELLELRRAAGVRGATLASALDALADVLRMQGRCERAEGLAREAVSEARFDRDVSPSERTRYEGRLGQILLDSGDEAGAQAAFQAALAFAEGALGPSHPTLAIVHQYLANAALMAGAFDEAERAYERAQTILDAFPDRGYLEERATLAHNRAELLARLGGLERARQEFERTLRLWQQAKGADHPHQAWTLLALGTLYADEGQELQARGYFERALALRRRWQPESAALAESLAAVAGADARAGRCASALTMGLQALRMSERAGAVRDTLARLAEQADVEVACGRPLVARVRLQAALARGVGLLGTGHPFVHELGARLAGVLLATGDARGALALALPSARAQARMARRTLPYLPESDGLAFAARLRRTRDLALHALLRARPRTDERRQALELLVESRALVEEAAALRARRQRAARDPDQVQAVRDQERLRARYAAAASASLSSAAGDAAQRLAALEAALDQAERTLARHFGSVSAATFERRELDLDEDLPASTALVSFARTGEAYLALVLRHAHDVAVVDLGPARRLDDAVAAWRAALDPRERTRAPRARERHEAQAREAGAQLTHSLWRPLERHLGNVSRVLLVPDGALALMPFAALPLAHGYLVEHGPTLHLLTSERELAPRPARPTRTTLVAVGGADYDRLPSASRDGLRTASAADCAPLTALDELPASAREVEEVAALLAHAWPDEHAIVLRDARANELELRRSAPQARILHLATHGFTRSAACPTLRNPFLRTGLALSGANRQAGPDADDDGLLTALEISGLDLEGCEWAVLSACGSALGQVESGEGVLGLPRALSIAGARSVVMSVMRVEDDAARAFMALLYKARLTRRRATDEALREASLARLRALRAAQPDGAAPPYDWAAFVAAGDWR